MPAEIFADVETVPALLGRRAELTPDAAAYFTQRRDGVWSATIWSEFRDDVAALSVQLARRGIAPGVRVGILGATSLDWEVAQMAALACGATVVGIDPYYPDTLVNEMVVDLGLTSMFVDDGFALRRLSSASRDRLALVAFLRDDPAEAQNGIPTLARLRAQEPGSHVWNPVAKSLAPALVVFSSGSVGRPRPILYTHAQILHACRCILDLYPEVTPGARLVCWLPLANLFQRMINFCATAKGAVSYMVEDPRRVMEVIPIANPEIFVAVPRFCEKLHAGMMQRFVPSPMLVRMVEYAIALGRALRDAEAGEIRLSSMKQLAAWLSDRLVLARLRAVMGRNLKFIVTGSAPMPRWLLDRFVALGIPVLEAYGTSENLVPITANRLGQRKTGTVGKPVGDNEVRIAVDGEVQVRGRGVFLPTLGANAARADSLTEDGYLATGDLGVFDDEGFLTLYGRRIETFKNAQGRWVSLAQIEAVLRRLPEVEHAAVLLRTHDRLIGILALSQEAASLPSPSPSPKRSSPLDRNVGPDGTRRHAQPSAAIVEKHLGKTLRERLARELGTLPAAMRPVAFLVVCAGFSPATGDLTTNLKLRRAVIAERLAEPLRALVGERNASATATKEEFTLKFV